MRVLLGLFLWLFSAYNTVPPPSLSTVSPYYAWNSETPTPGNGTSAASQQVFLDKPNTTFSVDGKFSGNPGVFEVDVQVAAVDADTNYQTIYGGAITVADAINYTFHLDVPGVNSRYVRLLMRSRTNSVSITATFNQ